MPQWKTVMKREMQVIKNVCLLSSDIQQCKLFCELCNEEVNCKEKKQKTKISGTSVKHFVDKKLSDFRVYVRTTAYSLVLSEYIEPEADDLPLSDDGTTIIGDNLENQTRKDVYRKHLERQRSKEFDRL